MNTLIAVAYVSSAVRLPTEAELEALLSDARAFNVDHAVTGALLYHDGTFFQYFEGPAEGVKAVYERIKAAKRHSGLVELLHEPVPQRQFSSWSMGFSVAPRSVILALEQAQWSQLCGQLQSTADAAPGLFLLLKFWQTSHSRMAYPAF